MSKNNNDCDIVLELLPLYLDEKTCEESNVFVKEHLAGCADCRQVHELMNADFSREETATVEETEKSRKSKRRRLSPTMKRTVILIGGLVGYFVLMVAVVAYAIWQLVCV